MRFVSWTPVEVAVVKGSALSAFGQEGVVPDVVAHNSACLASENSPDCRATLLLMQEPWRQ